VPMYVKNVALFCGAIVAAVSACAIMLAAAEVHYVYFDRHNLPDLGPFSASSSRPSATSTMPATGRSSSWPGAARDLALRGHSTRRP
jgi:hypothetical protein